MKNYGNRFRTADENKRFRTEKRKAQHDGVLNFCKKEGNEGRMGKKSKEGMGKSGLRYGRENGYGLKKVRVEKKMI